MGALNENGTRSMILAASPIHVATDWPAFGLFFLGLVTTIGGFTGWMVRRLDKNRADWKQFVTDEVKAAKDEMKSEFAQLAHIVDDNSRELREQGKAIARIEGRVGSGSGASAS